MSARQPVKKHSHALGLEDKGGRMLKELQGVVRCEVREEIVLHQHCLIKGEGW